MQTNKEQNKFIIYIYVIIIYHIFTVMFYKINLSLTVSTTYCNTVSNIGTSVILVVFIK